MAAIITPEGGGAMPPKLKRVIRLDSTPLSRAFYTSEGYLMDRPVLTSTGIFEYTNPDGSIRRELRLPEEVFDPESLASYRGKPIIVTHDAGLITKDNVSDESIGTILTDGYRDGEDVRAEIVIHDTDSMKDCRFKELSLGYNLDLDETPGVWEGQRYDAIQRGIRINHLALVREARAGEQARLNIDSRDSILKGGKLMKKTKKSTKRSRRADGVLSPEELAKAIEEYKARRAQRMAAKEDEEDTSPAVPAVAEDDEDQDIVVAPSNQDEENEGTAIEEQVQAVKDRRDRRDEAGDPETLEEANGVIANQDEDMGILFDIIDTLLAEKAFDEAEDEHATVAEDEDDDPNAPADVAADCENTDEDEENEDEDDDEAAALDEDDEMNEDDDDDPIPSSDPGDLIPGEVMNADSVDAIVKARIQLGMVGRKLNMDGLENMNILKAKKKVIRAVRPGIRLDGKSVPYINAMFACAVDDINRRTRKGTAYQKKQMFNQDSRSSRPSKESAEARRLAMIDRRMNRK